MRAHLFTAMILGLVTAASGCDVESKVRSLMGKNEGDEIVVKAPSGDIGYEIEKVEHL